MADPNILFVSWSVGGGAGSAASRLASALKAAGWSVRFLVLEGDSPGTQPWEMPARVETTSGPVNRWGRVLYAARVASRRLFWKFQAVWQDRFMSGQKERFEVVTLRQGNQQMDQHPWFQWADIIHLHWTAGFLAPKQPWASKKWVLSLHDCHPFTAICHFPAECTQFETGCALCPQLSESRDPALSSRRMRQKVEGYSAMTGVWLHAPSQWIADMASRSLLLGTPPVKVLPNLVPTGSFRTIDPAAARDVLSLPQRGKVALFAAGFIANTRKGFGWFQKLAETMSAGDWTFVVVGGGELPSLPKNCLSLGILTDPRLMAAAYASADVFITTALQDNLPSTLIEAQLCGTPVVGFATGGQPEMVDQGVTGWLEPEVSTDSLVRGLRWFEDTKPSRAAVAEWARDRWSEHVVLPQWEAFYRSIV